MSEANTQDLVVRKCKVVERGYAEPQVVCEIEWHGTVEDIFLDALLNEINKTAVFADGYAKAAQKRVERAEEAILNLGKRGT